MALAKGPQGVQGVQGDGKPIIIVLLFFAKVLGRVVGLAARTQTRLLTKAQSMGWKPTDLESMKLVHRQHQLFNYDMMKKRMKKMQRNSNEDYE